MANFGSPQYPAFAEGPGLLPIPGRGFDLGVNFGPGFQAPYEDQLINLAVNEEQLLKTYDLDNCNVAFVSLDLEALHPDVLKTLVTTNFYDPKVMETVRCIVKAAKFSPKEDINRQTAQSVKHWFKLRQVIGDDGAYGIVVSGGIRDADIFAVKITRVDLENTYTYTRSTSIHELFITTLGTNNLRQYNCGFAYLYGEFDCGAPAIFDNTVRSYCANTNTPVKYLLYEKINGPSWHTALSKMTQLEFSAMFVQLLNSLYIGRTVMNFCHNDLTSNNVMLREINRQYSVKITLPGLGGYVTTSVIPTMIDFGLSSITAEGKTYEWPGKTSNMMKDIYKFLSKSLEEAVYTTNTKVSPIIAAVLGYFRQDELTNSVILLERDKKKSRPKIGPQHTFEGLCEYLKGMVFYFSLEQQPQYPVLGCKDLTCAPNVPTVLRNVGIDVNAPLVPPKDLSDLQTDLVYARTNPEFYQEIFRHVNANLAKYTDDILDMFGKIDGRFGVITFSYFKEMRRRSITLEEKLQALGYISRILIDNEIDLHILSQLVPLFKNKPELVQTLNELSQRHGQIKNESAPLFTKARRERDNIIQTYPPVDASALVQLIDSYPMF
jgi:tRNA A-37 threonylcarbamoyl transferase component Bud32